MLRATVNGKQNVLPTSQAKGICPWCGERVFARCGEKKTHHWSHYPKSKCCGEVDREPETEWHKRMKNLFSEEYREIVNTKNGEHRRADIWLPNSKTAIEFQHSSIRHEVIEARHNVHGRIVWVFDCNKKGAFSNADVYINPTNRKNKISLPLSLEYLKCLAGKDTLLIFQCDVKQFSVFYIVETLRFGKTIGGYGHWYLSDNEFHDKMMFPERSGTRKIKTDIFVHKRHGNKS